METADKIALSYTVKHGIKIAFDVSGLKGTWTVWSSDPHTAHDGETSSSAHT